MRHLRPPGKPRPELAYQGRASGFESTTMTYTYSSSVQKTFVFAAVVLGLLVVTLPLAVYFLVKSRSAKLVLDDGGLTVSGLGGTARWDFADIERLGTLTVEVVGGGPLAQLNGGPVAVNLVARTKSGKTHKFMLSRFERWEEILDRVQQATGLPVEAVSPGLVSGVAWPQSAR